MNSSAGAIQRISVTVSGRIAAPTVLLLVSSWPSSGAATQITPIMPSITALISVNIVLATSLSAALSCSASSENTGTSAALTRPPTRKS